MKNELKVAVIGAIVGAFITGAISLFIYFDGKNGIETKTVETLTKYFDSVDKDMSYNEALEAVYKESKKMKSELGDLRAGNINGILVESAQQFANSKDYVSALSILNGIEKKSYQINNLINEYTKKYESDVTDQVESLVDEDNTEEAKKILETALKIVPNSKVIKNKKQEINNLYRQNMVEIVPAYQSGGNEYKEYNTNKTGGTEFFKMAGIKYSDGMTFNADINIFDDVSWAIYNLNGKYTSLNFTVGHVDDTDIGDKTVLQVLYDGKLKKEIPLAPDMLSRKVKLNVTGVKQLKLQVPSSGSDSPLYGIGNPVIQ